MHVLRSRWIRLAIVAVAALFAGACAAETARTPKTVLVAGANGQTGQLIVKHLQKQGYQVRALVREPAKAQALLGPDVTYVHGNVTDPASLTAAMSGVDAVISAIGARGKEGPDRPEMIDHQGVDAAKQAGAQQFVLMSSRGVTQEDHILNRMFGDVLKWKLKGEDYLRASGLAYTIVRPGGLRNEAGGTGDIVLEQGDRRFEDGTPLLIPREDVAIICVEALKYPEARFRTFETHRVDGAPVTDWRSKFAALKPD
jgi:uncharacterized protein YbjT (DUF2867 family)